MQTHTIVAEQIKQEIVHSLDDLPENSLLFLKDLTRLLHAYSDRPVVGERRIVQLGGLWKGIEFTEDEIGQARREAWESLGRDFDA